MRLREEIEEIHFLTPIVLESEGARSTTVEDESIRWVEECDIFLSILGVEFSDLVVKEYTKAVREKKPRLVYIQQVKKRNEKLEEFISKEIGPRVKYQGFTTYSTLKESVINDLYEIVGQILSLGIKALQKEIDTVEITEMLDTVEVTEDVVLGKPKPLFYYGGARKSSEDLSSSFSVESTNYTSENFSVSPQRIQILLCLAGGASRVKDLTRATGIYGAVLSMRLRELHIRALVSKGMTGRQVYYKITSSGISELEAYRKKHFSR